MGYICKVVGANEFFNVTTEMIKTSQSSDTILYQLYTYWQLFALSSVHKIIYEFLFILPYELPLS